MILSITNTTIPATDLSWLLHKHPDKIQTFKLSAYGQTRVFYPEVSEERCTATLVLEIDPVILSRGHSGRQKEGFVLQPYVNDRPYVASSFMSKALTATYSSALNGHCKDKPKLPEKELELEVHLPVLPCSGGENRLRALFEPLGYSIEATSVLLDEKFPEWGQSRYFDVRLKVKTTLKTLLRHLYILIPVLDGDKHYWLNDHEIDKLLEKGEGWLETHPNKKFIVNRYFKFMRGMAKRALDLMEETQPENSKESEKDLQEIELEENITHINKIPLNQQRLEAVLKEVLHSNAKSVLDLGCGSGKLLQLLLKENQLENIVGMDVSHRVLQMASERLYLKDASPAKRNRIKLIQGSLIYKDNRLENFDAAVLVEVIEHIEPSRLEALERVVFEFAKPNTVIITTPNSEFNILFKTLPEGKFRHSDHRFEWTRKEFQDWATNICNKYNYTVNFKGIGPEDEKYGTPTQMAIFNLK